MSARRRRDFRPRLDPLDGRILLSASGLTPAQIGQAYSENFTFNVNGRSYAATGAGQTIAIVIGGLDPYIANDLSTFDQNFGLPAPPSFKSVSFQGAQNNESAGGIGETSLDVEWSHAVAPGANILLVQAKSMSISDLMVAVDWARHQPGVSVVSMSWGGPESSADTQYNSIFTTPAGHTGVTFVASSGDSGFFNSHQVNSVDQIGVEWPASDPNVLSVGGTTLSTTANGSYVGETVWDLNYDASAGGWWGSGGGLSRVYAEPSYQDGVQRTGVRTVPDVAYNADINSGVLVYNSLDGWGPVGGTSAAAPQWAGLIAEADQGRALVGLNPLDGPSQTLPAIYTRPATDFHDITSGSNGYPATPGYDLATGLGTPIVYRLVGDLAFQVTSNYAASTAHALDVSHSLGLSFDGRSSIEMAPLPAVASPSGEDGPVAHSAAEAGVAESSTPASLLMALPPTGPTSPFVTTGHRHGRLDLALGSLVDEDLAFLTS
jgi:subtilase family serine protease